MAVRGGRFDPKSRYDRSPTGPDGQFPYLVNAERFSNAARLALLATFLALLQNFGSFGASVAPASTMRRLSASPRAGNFLF